MSARGADAVFNAAEAVVDFDYLAGEQADVFAEPADLVDFVAEVLT